MALCLRQCDWLLQPVLIVLLGLIVTSIAVPLPVAQWTPPLAARTDRETEGTADNTGNDPPISSNMLSGAHAVYFYSTQYNVTELEENFDEHLEEKLDEHQKSLFSHVCDSLQLYDSLTNVDTTSDFRSVLDKTTEESCIWFRALRNSISDTDSSASEEPVNSPDQVTSSNPLPESNCSTGDWKMFRLHCLDFSLQRKLLDLVYSLRNCDPCPPVDWCKWADMMFPDDRQRNRIKCRLNTCDCNNVL